MSNKYYIEQLERMRSRLLDPFHSTDIEWRIQQAGMSNGKPWGMCLAYITSRAVMNRLDEVFGIDGWKDSYREWMGTSVVCTLSVRMPDGVWVSKEDGADNTDIEATKGGISDALKRVAVKYGIGRYLYNLPATWAVFVNEGVRKHKMKDGNYYAWNPPILPDWAIPDSEREQRANVVTTTKEKKSSTTKEQAAPEPVDDKRKKGLLSELSALQIELNQTPEQEEVMLNYFKVKEREEMTVDQMKECIQLLKRKLKK